MGKQGGGPEDCRPTPPSRVPQLALQGLTRSPGRSVLVTPRTLQTTPCSATSTSAPALLEGGQREATASLRWSLVALEQRVSRELQRVKEEATAPLARLEARLGNLPGIAQRIAELSGSYSGLSEALQAQIARSDRSEQRLTDLWRGAEQELRAQHANLERYCQKVSSTCSTATSAVEDSLRSQGLRLRALEEVLEELSRPAAAGAAPASEQSLPSRAAEKHLGALDEKLERLLAESRRVEARVEAQEEKTSSFHASLDKIRQLEERLQLPRAPCNGADSWRAGHGGAAEADERPEKGEPHGGAAAGAKSEGFEPAGILSRLESAEAHFEAQIASMRTEIQYLLESGGPSGFDHARLIRDVNEKHSEINGVLKDVVRRLSASESKLTKVASDPGGSARNSDANKLVRRRSDSEVCEQREQRRGSEVSDCGGEGEERRGSKGEMRRGSKSSVGEGEEWFTDPALGLSHLDSSVVAHLEAQMAAFRTEIQFVLENGSPSGFDHARLVRDVSERHTEMSGLIRDVDQRLSNTEGRLRSLASAVGKEGGLEGCSCAERVDELESRLERQEQAQDDLRSELETARAAAGEAAAPRGDECPREDDSACPGSRACLERLDKAEEGFKTRLDDLRSELRPLLEGSPAASAELVGDLGQKQGQQLALIQDVEKRLSTMEGNLKALASSLYDMKQLTESVGVEHTTRLVSSSYRKCVTQDTPSSKASQRSREGRSP